MTTATQLDRRLKKIEARFTSGSMAGTEDSYRRMFAAIHAEFPESTGSSWSENAIALEWLRRCVLGGSTQQEREAWGRLVGMDFFAAQGMNTASYLAAVVSVIEEF